MKSLLLLAMLLACAGCGQPRIDTSSDAAMKASVGSVRESLPAERRGEFDEALLLLAFEHVDVGNLLAAGTPVGAEALLTKVKASVEGKTGVEVLAVAASVRKEREAKEQAQAEQEIAELRNTRDEAQKAKLELEKFRVSRSRFYKQDDILGPEPVIELTVQNGANFAVAQVSFIGTLASPGRAVPWLRDEFSYEIQGGLEPGELASWRLAPNRFGEWGTVKARGDAILTLEVVELVGASGQKLSTRDFSDTDALRLAELEAKY